MFLHIRSETDFFFTNITGIRTLASVYKPISHHNRYLTESLITHITGIQTLATVQAGFALAMHGMSPLVVGGRLVRTPDVCW